MKGTYKLSRVVFCCMALLIPRSDGLECFSHEHKPGAHRRYEPCCCCAVLCCAVFCCVALCIPHRDALQPFPHEHQPGGLQLWSGCAAPRLPPPHGQYPGRMCCPNEKETNATRMHVRLPKGSDHLCSGALWHGRALRLAQADVVSFSRVLLGPALWVGRNPLFVLVFGVCQIIQLILKGLYLQDDPAMNLVRREAPFLPVHGYYCKFLSLSTKLC